MLMRTRQPVIKFVIKPARRVSFSTWPLG